VIEIFRNPARTSKPRESGLTHVLDKGMSLSEAEGLIEVAGEFVDIVKFGWATAAVIGNLEKKIELFRKAGIPICCGGSFFELAFMKGRVDEYIGFLKEHDFKIVEVSDGVIEIEAAEKLRYIESLAKDFTVLSEVGSKDASVVVAPFRWVKGIKDELAAGAWKVVAEGRESGTVGLYRGSGEIRTGLIEEIENEIESSRILFEAPQKSQQVWLIQHFGLNVNLGNIPPQEVISVETLRQGLRGDTLGR
jgi:phosphosulfolactate synthase